MEAVDIPNKGELYVWIKNKDKAEGKVVLKDSGTGVVKPFVVSDYTVEGYIESLHPEEHSRFFLFREGVEAWGYDLREFTAYTMEEEKKYVWYTPSEGRVLYKGTYEVGMRMVDSLVNMQDLVGGSDYMLSEAEVDASLYDKRKFLAMDSEGVHLVEGYELGTENLPSAGISSAKIYVIQYKLSDKFVLLHSKDLVVITVGSKGEADILSGLLQVDKEYREGTDALLVYPYSTGYSADFTAMEGYMGKYPVLSFAESVVKLKSPFA